MNPVASRRSLSMFATISLEALVALLILLQCFCTETTGLVPPSYGNYFGTNEGDGQELPSYNYPGMKLKVKGRIIADAKQNLQGDGKITPGDISIGPDDKSNKNLLKNIANDENIGENRKNGNRDNDEDSRSGNHNASKANGDATDNGENNGDIGWSVETDKKNRGSQDSNGYSGNASAEKDKSVNEGKGNKNRKGIIQQIFEWIGGLFCANPDVDSYPQDNDSRVGSNNLIVSFFNGF